jgi:hypothetical protein
MDEFQDKDSLAEDQEIVGESELRSGKTERNQSWNRILPCCKNERVTQHKTAKSAEDMDHRRGDEMLLTSWVTLSQQMGKRNRCEHGEPAKRTDDVQKICASVGDPYWRIKSSPPAQIVSVYPYASDSATRFRARSCRNFIEIVRWRFYIHLLVVTVGVVGQ